MPSDTIRSLPLAHQVWFNDTLDFEATYREVAEAGISSVVLAAKRGNLDLRVPEQAAQAGRILKQLGLAAVSCHGLDFGPSNLNEADSVLQAEMIAAHINLIANAAELGCKTYVFHLGPLPVDEPKSASWDRIRVALDELAPAALPLGLTLALENGLPGYQATNEELLDFVAGYGCPTVGICYDSGHAHVTADAASVLLAFSPHVVTVHLHDNDGTSDQHLIPGQGTIAWPGVASALAQCPRLLHAETEAANSLQWPPTPEVWELSALYDRYCEVLNVPGTEVSYQ